MPSKIERKKPIHSQEDIDTLFSRAFPANPGVCSHCREALCDNKTATEYCLNGATTAPHHTDGPANAACTRAKLVEVKGCRDCLLTGHAGHEGGMISCRHPAAPTPNDVWCYYWRDVEASRPPLCPLLDDGKPNAGVRIVAEVEA